jgi:hypothetical protein
MMECASELWQLWIGLTLGNALYALLMKNTPSGWGRAAELSFFQGIAFLAAWLWVVKP